MSGDIPTASAAIRSTSAETCDRMGGIVTTSAEISAAISNIAPMSAAIWANGIAILS